MEIIFVGTGSGRTSLKGFHSSICFREKNKNILIDVGDGISKALLSQGIKYNSITDILISHYHSDHFAGLPSLLTQMIIENRSDPLKIYTHSKMINSLISFLQISYIFLSQLKFKVEVIGFNFENECMVNNEFNFLAKQNSHIVNKYNLEIEGINFLSSSFLFNCGDKKIVYTSDIGRYEDLFLFQDCHADIFITEATHIPLNRIEDANTILNPQKLILTHIDNEEETINWFNKLSSAAKKAISIAEDGTSIIFR